MAEAILWGVVAASSLTVGALLGVARRWPERQIGLILAFGAGALISAVSFELAEEGIEVGGSLAVAIGLAVGALTYWTLNGLLERRQGGGASDLGPALALGATLDGIPEQLVLGIGIAAGQGVSIGLLVAIFVSNVPEAVGSSSAMRDTGRGRGRVVGMWAGVTLVCATMTVAGFAFADVAPDRLTGGIDGFAAGALLVMLADSMIPEATRKSGTTAGIVLAMGFAVSALLPA